MSEAVDLNVAHNIHVPEWAAGHIAPTLPAPQGPLSTYQVIRGLMRNPVETWARELFERPVATYDFGRQWVFAMAPEYVSEILVGQQSNFPKSELDRRILNRLVDDSVLITRGPRWRWQRQAVAGVFQPSALKPIVPIFTEAARRQCHSWLDGRATSRVDVDLTSLAFDIIQTSMLGGQAATSSAEAERQIEAFTRWIPWEISYFGMGLPSWFPHPGSRTMANASRYLRTELKSVIEQRRSEKSSAQDLLDRLLAATDPETGKGMSDAYILDNLLTFLIAGHETTASSLTWTLFLLAKYPEWQERIAREVHNNVGDDEISAEHISKLDVTRQVLSEAMRVYAPAPMIARVAEQPTGVLDVDVSADALIFLPLYVIHRHELLWDKPEVFWPERFTRENMKSIPKFAYMPFGSGPRTCVGNSFAMQESIVLLAEFMRRVRFSLVDAEDPVPVARITLRPRGGLRLKVEAVPS